MPIYRRLGTVPHKRHVRFDRPDGQGLYYEELMGNMGFAGLSSLLYHLRRPTQIRSAELLERRDWEPAEDRSLRPRHFRTARIAAGGDIVRARHPLLYNEDVALSIAAPDRDPQGFYRNGQGDEIVFVLDGEGVLESPFGALAWGPGDYVVIPRGILHAWRTRGGEGTGGGASRARMLVIESRGYVRTPARYRNPHGQLLEHAPFCERDIRAPEPTSPRDETGEYEVLVKQGNALYRYVYATHPFDVVGWDGYYYPWAFNIGDFEPITGRLHQPPPVHQTFEGDGWVVCSFVPRLFDYHPDAIPAPYHHSNVGSEEVLFYVSEQFMSRKGIERGSMTHHPDGIPHGPHPGAVEASIGTKETEETAVMLDAFRPLIVSRSAESIEDRSYLTSWLEPGEAPAPR